MERMSKALEMMPSIFSAFHSGSISQKTINTSAIPARESWATCFLFILKQIESAFEAKIVIITEKASQIIWKAFVERKTGLGPATSTLARLRSTN